MKDSEIYAKAAQLLEQSPSAVPFQSCCWAISEITHPSESPRTFARDKHCREMKSVFAPYTREAFWMEQVGNSPQEKLNGRILALCFMAAIAQSEGR